MELFFGINFLGHDSALFVIDPQKKDVFAISSERISRFKHDVVFSETALEKYIQQSGIEPGMVTRIVCGVPRLEQKSQLTPENYFARQQFLREFFGEPYLKGYMKQLANFNGLTEAKKNFILLKAGRLRQYRQLFNSGKRVYVRELLKGMLTKYFPSAHIELNFFDHEECHAVSGYFTSGFESDVLLITMDAQGDHNRFSSVYTVRDGHFEELAVSVSPKKFFSFGGPYVSVESFESSVGGMYTYFTFMLGFTPNADEGKVEALAAFGNYKNEIYDKLWNCFSIDDKHRIIVHQEEAELLFSVIEFDRFLSQMKKEDICAAIQKFLEEIMLQYIKGLINLSGIRKLCFSGGVFANVILNLRVFEELSQEIYVIPAMTDEGTAEGAAYSACLKQMPASELRWLNKFTMPYFGTSYSAEAVRKIISKYPELQFEDLSATWPEKAAQLSAEGKVGALFHGRMEWGPRALGNRSIIAACNDAEITKKINGSIKNRPLFQPFCPSILLEERERLFETSYPNKHMTCAFRMKQEHREKIPASVHVDGTGRAQFVEESDNPMYYRYLKEMKRLTGYGVSINTSFNKHGRTIVETPDDAIRDFLDTNMDYVMIEGYYITRK